MGAVTAIRLQGTEETRAFFANLRLTEDDGIQNSKIEENDRTQSEQERIPEKHNGKTMGKRTFRRDSKNYGRHIKLRKRLQGYSWCICLVGESFH